MPYRVIDGPKAFDNRRGNAFSTWPSRDEATNRLEPFCRPAIKGGFTLVPGEKVFTIGSCFARNIEGALGARGFDVVTRRLLEQGPELKRHGLGILNNYGVASIFNELSWALDPERPFDAEASIHELMPGKHIDIHVPITVRAGSMADVMERRRLITEATRDAADCRVIVMTLGLTEVWFDRAHDLYLNQTPPRSLIERHGGRFELHVLSADETIAHLERTIDLLRRRCRADQQILLSVSPVPLSATHTDQDVVIANCYSKAVLRTAAEAICSRHAHVHYYPSYESVIHSERHVAWEADQVHVRRELIELNVDRMLAAFAPPEAGSATGTPGTALMAAKDALERRDPHAAVAFLAPYKDRLADHGEAATTLAEALIRLGRGREASEALASLPPAPGDWRLRLLEARAFAAAARPADAARVLESLPTKERERVAVLRVLTRAFIDLARWDEARIVALRWAEVSNRSAPPYRALAQIHAAEGRDEEAEAAFRMAMDRERGDATYALDLVEFLIGRKRFDDARAVLQSVQPSSGANFDRLASLRLFAG